MKQIKKIFCLIMTIAFVFTFACPVPTADAATMSINEGEWTYANSENGYYKVTVSGEGYITITSKTDEAVSTYYEILNSKKHEFLDYNFLDDGFYTSKTIKVAVSKGTYYLHYLGGEGNEMACIKYTFTPIKQPTNYCKAKAISLKSGTKKTMYQTPKYGFVRYFKIKVSSKKKITVYAESDITIISSKGKIYDTTSSYLDDNAITKYRTTKKLPAGTYYLISDIHSPGLSAINTIKWQ